jgi:gamma-glutamyltranspeptidase/glutathione hydrolase
MATAPHYLAAQAGVGVLQDGGNALDAAVAIAAVLAVVYPHMNGIGGDGFWLVREPDGRVHAIDACGRAATGANLRLYSGHKHIPTRGPLAANTVAGTISGWQLALAGGRLPVARVLRDAIHHAEHGVAITAGGAMVAAAKGKELRAQPGAYATIFEPDHRPLREGELLRQPQLAETLRTLVLEGLDSFYIGTLAGQIAGDLETLGSPLRLSDLQLHRPERVTPLSVAVNGARLYNLPPPTQGVASLLILALAERLDIGAADSFEHVHFLVEASKRAFLYRDTHVGDPAYMHDDPQALLDDAIRLDEVAAEIDAAEAMPWPRNSAAGDTCWFGAADDEGRVVSAIQSNYHEFGSGVVLPATGIAWQNRGTSFHLTPDGWNALKPGRKPFHTLNPALACFDDGRVMAYGTMGGEGQPQTQAAIFTRYGWQGVGLQDAISRPRWLLGRTWGEATTSLKIEDGFAAQVYERLRAAGHHLELVGRLDMMMGHAGALVRHADGSLEGATDPRSDGQVAAW